MSINLSNSQVNIRDSRLGSITSYHGDAQTLIDQSKDRALHFRNRSYSQCSDCSQGCAETLVYHIRGAAVVTHAPIGCNAGVSGQNYTARAVSVARGQEIHNVHMISTNIQEKDTVYGGLEKLRETIQEAYDRFSPSAIFVTSSCASGIVGDDIESVTCEMENELGIPVIPVFCEGFKSRVWTTGFDAAYHSILRKLVKPPQKKQKDLVNIFNFQGGDTFSSLLKKMNLRSNYLVPLATVEQLAEMSEAAVSVHMCETLGTYISAALEEQYGVPEVKAPAPFGVEWTDKWIRAIAKETGREKLAEKVIAQEHERIAPQLQEIREKLKGKKVYVFAGDSFAHSLANLAIDVGLELVGITTLHHDQKVDNTNSEELITLDNLIKSRGNITEFSVCNKQPYEVIKILKRLRPDVMIVRHQGLTVLSAKLGIPAINEGDANASVGYDGVIKFGNRVYDALRTIKFEKNIAAHVKFPYSKWWLEEEPDPFYFEKEEEK
ncbi:nitrogenase molybdenum-iron protein alpha chain [Kineothrix alysoides]|uniref:Nitrogenase molybdenum-iron protein alpha chain n=2 Tax=Kineothrix alysoides TaxID=1469948 RepID=A0A4R1R3Q4_9FIRM|nr:nitrogenase component 1 [Kineothrix alysoides]TCL60018.1 nitrogenase molybdenum-iron protein alpha chain [Kineothrix alysoides]